MATAVHRLALPEDLEADIRAAARETKLSMTEVMRQSIKMGLPKLRQSVAGDKLKPMTREEIRRCYEVPNPEFDALAHHCANLPEPPPEDD